MSVLEDVIAEDFEIEGREGSRWAKLSKHDSFVIDREKETFYWNSQGVHGDALTYLTKVRGMSFSDAKKYLEKFKFSSLTYINREEPGEVVVYPALVDLFWKNGQEKREYWYKRCLIDETIDRWRLGFFDGWYTIPIYLEGKLINLQKRRDEPRKMILPWYETGNPHPFNFDILRLTSKIVIVEGLVDAILLNQLGIPSVSKDRGSQAWLDGWFHYFVRQKEIYYVGDNDKAGNVGAALVARKLGVNRTKVYTFEGFADKYDTGNFFQDGGTREEFLNLIETKSYYTY